MTESSNLLSAIVESFYSNALYRKVQTWRGTALVYLGLVLFLCWGPLFIKFQVMAKAGFDHAAEALAGQIPVIRFEYGHLVTPENKPYLIEFGKGPQKVQVIIDTSGKYSSLDGQSAQILATKNKIFMRQRSGEVRTYDLSKATIKPMTIDQGFIQKVLVVMRRWVLPAMYILVFGLSYFKRLFQAFLISLIGLGLSSLLEADLDLGELLSLAIVAMTPAMVLQAALSIAGKSFSKQWLLWIVLIAGYFIFAVNAASDKTLPTEESDSL